MEDDRWTTKDKLNQLRGVTALYKNTNANIKEKITSQRTKQTKDIKNLTTQNKKYRQQYEEVLQGDKQRLLPVLHAHPTQLMAFKNHNPQQIVEELKQSIFCKNKELDRLRYKKKQLEENFLKKKLELGDLQMEVEDAPQNYLWEQEIANKMQSIKVKLNAARANRTVYEKAINILQKDAIRSDEVLDSLKRDLEHQCESVVKAVEMGQAVTIELESLQKEYKATEKTVRANMRERDRALRALRVEIENIRLHGLSNARESHVAVDHSALRESVPVSNRESDINLQDLMKIHVMREITAVESILSQVKAAALVHKIQDIFPRLEEQKRQKARLQRQVEENEEQLSRMLELRNQLDVMLEVTKYHTMTEEAEQVKMKKMNMMEEIKEEQESLEELNKEVVEVGERVANIRSALLTLNIMLDVVYTGGGEPSVMDIGQSSDSEVIPGQLRPLYQPNMEALTLMEQVIKKVRWLVDQVGSKREDKEFKTKLATTFAVESSFSKLIVEDEADNIVSDMLDELENMDDPSVPTRKDIKAESERLVHLFDNPRAMFQESSLPKFKKHKCF